MKSVDKTSIAVMRVLDGLWETYKWVPVSKIEERMKLRPVKIRSTIRHLEKTGFIGWSNFDKMGEHSVNLKENGKDMLAIWDLRKHGVIDDIGHVVGEGKEAKVVLGIKDEKMVAIKFHRYYSAEFRKIQESLAFTALKWWKETKKRFDRPVVIERAKAQIEFRSLEKLAKGKIRVPKPLGINRHVIVMEFIGDKLPAPLLVAYGKHKQDFAEETIAEYERAVKVGIVHGDMSEFNVMIWNDEPWLIDWPQAVPVDFKGAEKLLKRDREKLELLRGT